MRRGTALTASHAVYGRRTRPAAPGASLRFGSQDTDGRKRDRRAPLPPLKDGRYDRKRQTGKRCANDMGVRDESRWRAAEPLSSAVENGRRCPEDLNAATGTMTVHRAPPRLHTLNAGAVDAWTPAQCGSPTRGFLTRPRDAPLRCVSQPEATIRPSRGGSTHGSRVSWPVGALERINTAFNRHLHICVHPAEGWGAPLRPFCCPVFAPLQCADPSFAYAITRKPCIGVQD